MICLKADITTAGDKIGKAQLKDAFGAHRSQNSRKFGILRYGCMQMINGWERLQRTEK